MRIGLNATCFNSRPSGAKQRFIGIYSRLVNQLNEHNFFIFHSNEYNIKKEFGQFKNVKFIKINIPSDNSIKKNFIYFFKFKKIISRYDLDIIEIFNLPAFLPKNLKYFLTIHDIRNNYFKFSGIFNFFAKITLKFFLKKAFKIITVSKTMKNEINDFYKNHKTDVVYNGLEKKYFKNSLKKNKKENYMLSVGHFEKRKNFINLINAFSKFQNINNSFKLVIVGNAYTKSEKYHLIKVKNLIKSKSLQSKVKIFNNVNQDSLINLYNNSFLFITTSVYEGFGITILEAMKSKRIILASNLKVFKEISPKGIVFFNQKDEESIFKTMNQAIRGDKHLKKKIEYNNKRIKRFEFDKVTMDLVKLYLKYNKLIISHIKL